MESSKHRNPSALSVSSPVSVVVVVVIIASGPVGRIIFVIIRRQIYNKAAYFRSEVLRARPIPQICERVHPRSGIPFPSPPPPCPPPSPIFLSPQATVGNIKLLKLRQSDFLARWIEQTGTRTCGQAAPRERRRAGGGERGGGSPRCASSLHAD